MVARRALTVLVASALLGGLVSSAPGAAARPQQKVQRGKFTATGYPYPQILSGGCRTGVEGVSYTSQEFTPPADGELAITMIWASGNWDFTIYDAETGGELLNAWEGGWLGEPTMERDRLYLEKGRSVVITACNFLSSQFEVEVTYVFRPGKKPV